ncbi:uncharacterized protein HD556DRAFT_1458280 [Suillus plorans]|uniref:SMP-LTD domain-containing protein n=1 Tax=Suillus plorans TaxID=116603 RepID=A0A9P7DNT5_9AGAM|nr:uncharacterized protein HD556DRAFT_1458280 [Suillus plorans]KAG1799429.1 hypothetical protein HD556DRAFT_1458280 [Suillus plorans]
MSSDYNAHNNSHPSDFNDGAEVILTDANFRLEDRSGRSTPESHIGCHGCYQWNFGQFKSEPSSPDDEEAFQLADEFRAEQPELLEAQGGNHNNADAPRSKRKWSEDDGGVTNMGATSVPIVELPPKKRTKVERKFESFEGELLAKMAAVMQEVVGCRVSKGPALSNSGSWRIVDDEFNNQEFYHNIIDYLELPPTPEAAKEISSFRVFTLPLIESQRELIKTCLAPKHESADWMNKFLDRLWLIYEPVLSATIVAFVDQMLSTTIPAFSDSLRLTTFTLGTKTSRIDKVRTSPRTANDVAMMVWGISFIPNHRNPKIVQSVRLGKGLATAFMPIPGLQTFIRDIIHYTLSPVSVSFTDTMEDPPILRLVIHVRAAPEKSVWCYIVYTAKPHSQPLHAYDRTFLKHPAFPSDPKDHHRARFICPGRRQRVGLKRQRKCHVARPRRDSQKVLWDL